MAGAFMLFSALLVQFLCIALDILICTPIRFVGQGLQKFGGCLVAAGLVTSWACHNTARTMEARRLAGDSQRV